MSNPLISLLDDRDADGEKQPQRAGTALSDAVPATSNTFQGGVQSSPVIAQSFWSDPAPELALDNTRDKTTQARSATGYMEILSTTLFDGVGQDGNIYRYGLPAGVLTRTY